MLRQSEFTKMLIFVDSIFLDSIFYLCKMGVHSHRSNTNWKQKNKGHKTGKHASKRSINKMGQEVVSSNTKNSVKNAKQQCLISKVDRKNMSKLRRKRLNSDSNMSDTMMDSGSIYSSMLDLSQIGAKSQKLQYVRN